MYEKIILNYLNNLKKEDITSFALQNDIKLNLKEVDYLYQTLKNNYQFLLGNDYEIVFLEAKQYLTSENYKKIYALYLKYKNIYKDLL